MHSRLNYFIVSCLLIITYNNGSAQDKAATKKIPTHNYTTHTRDGKTKSTVVTISGDDSYRMEMENEKITALYVNDEKIPESRYKDYGSIIEKLMKQIEMDKKQALEDQRQAKKDQVQARRDQQQTEKDLRQAKLDEEHSMKDKKMFEADKRRAMKEKKMADTEEDHLPETKKNAEESKRDAMAKKENAESDSRDQIEVEENVEEEEQASRDHAQAQLDQEQAARDQVQAKKDQEQAAEDQRQLKLLISDLIKDGIIADEKALHTLSLSKEGMTVNNVKQSNEITNRYKEKYKRFSTGDFYYESRGNGIKSIQMHR